MAEITTSPSAPVSDPAPSSVGSSSSSSMLPRVTIRFCTQCKWMLRAAYYAQELLSTFSTGLGEVALQPSTGGTFIVEILAAVTTPNSSNNNDAQLPGGAVAATTAPGIATTQHRVLWDRTVDGGFPETKELKRRVRDVIEPNRDLGHVDRDHARKPKPAAAAAAATAASTASPSSHEAPVPPAAAAATQESISTSSSSANPTITRDAPGQGQSHPRMPAVAAAGPPASSTPGNTKGDGAARGAVCEDCQ